MAGHRQTHGESPALLARAAEDADAKAGDIGESTRVLGRGSNLIRSWLAACHTSPMTASGEPGGPHWLARMRMDITPLRTSRDFRIIFVSGVITYLGSMITYVAVPFQVAAITGSYVAVGLIGLVELVPLVAFGLYGGALADAVDRRVMVIATEVAGGALALVLLANALSPIPQTRGCSTSWPC